MNDRLRPLQRSSGTRVRQERIRQEKCRGASGRRLSDAVVVDFRIVETMGPRLTVVRAQAGMPLPRPDAQNAATSFVSRIRALNLPKPGEGESVQGEIGNSQGLSLPKTWTPLR